MLFVKKISGKRSGNYNNFHYELFVFTSLHLSDGEKINAIDGTMLKNGDRLSSLKTAEFTIAGRGGGSDRKLRRPHTSHLIETLSASEGKPRGMGRRRIYN